MEILPTTETGRFRWVWDQWNQMPKEISRRGEIRRGRGESQRAEAEG